MYTCTWSPTRTCDQSDCMLNLLNGQLVLIFVSYTERWRLHFYVRNVDAFPCLLVIRSILSVAMYVMPYAF